MTQAMKQATKSYGTRLRTDALELRWRAQIKHNAMNTQLLLEELEHALWRSGR